MKITDVKLIYAKHYLFVKIYTDAGIVGLGEAGIGDIWMPLLLPFRSSLLI